MQHARSTAERCPADSGLRIPPLRASRFRLQGFRLQGLRLQGLRLQGLGGLPLLVLPSLLLLLACDRGQHDQPDDSLDPSILLRIGDATLDRSEFEELERYFRSVQPELGRRTLRKNLLDLHFLPLIADRMFEAEARAAALASAENLRAVTPTASVLAKRLELERIEPQWLGWTDLPFEAREFACDQLSVGGVGPVFAAPGAFYVIGVLEVERRALRKADRARIVFRRFPIRQGENGDEPESPARNSLRGLPLTAAPDIRDALPAWLTER